MSEHIMIQDCVPAETIAAITNAALLTYLKRHGWNCVQIWTHQTGVDIATWEKADDRFDVPVSYRFADHIQRMAEAIMFVVRVDKQRSADVIGELQSVVAENATSGLRKVRSERTAR